MMSVVESVLGDWDSCALGFSAHFDLNEHFTLRYRASMLSIEGSSSFSSLINQRSSCTLMLNDVEEKGPWYGQFCIDGEIRLC